MAKKKIEKAEEVKGAKQDPGQTQRAAAQAVQSYFTKEVNDAVGEMADDVMWAKLRQLETSEYWIAVLRYNNLRLLNAQSALNTMDPVQNPSAISRQQGAMMGLVDLQNSIIIMVEDEKEDEKEDQEIAETF